jgi:hypothetical protein
MDHIFIKFLLKTHSYLGFVEKKNNEIIICKTGSSGISALIDDISGLIDVVPDHFTQDNEMVRVIQPVKLMSWLKENPEKAAMAREKLPWLKDIDESGNPVIAIGKYKI